MTRQPVRMPVTDYLEFTGNTQAINTVQLRARVEGYLRSIDYVEGSTVEKGKLLFTIDDQQYLAALAQALAQHEREKEGVQQELLPMPPLTLREEEVLKLMSEGLRNKEIAARLGVTERTATFHVGNVLAKLGADGRVDLGDLREVALLAHGDVAEHLLRRGVDDDQGVRGGVGGQEPVG